MIKFGAATILTAIIIPLFVYGNRYTRKVDALEIKGQLSKEVLNDIKDDIKDIKNDIKTLIRRYHE